MMILFMKANNILITLVTLLVTVESQAQDLGTILFGKDYKATYMGQYNYNGKRKNGFGIERYKNGAVYIGDFSEDNISGRGMFISAMGQYIDKKSNASIYVGAYRDGKKSGKGTFYDANGNVIYDGKFENDKPIDNNPSNASSSNKRFVMVESNQELYWGESLDGVANGMGLKLKDDGSILFGRYKDGIPTSIGMIFYSPEMWEVGRWTDGAFVAFNNSQLAKEKLEQFKVQHKQGNKQMWAELAEAGKYFAQAAVLVAEATSPSSSSVSPSALDEAMDSTPTGSGNNYKEANDKKREERKEKERQNNFKKNDKLMEAAYSKCEDNLVDMYVNPEHYSNLSKEEFRRKYKDLQRQLKKIRTDHEQKTGSKYFVSEYETKACPI